MIHVPVTFFFRTSWAWAFFTHLIRSWTRTIFLFGQQLLSLRSLHPNIVFHDWNPRRDRSHSRRRPVEGPVEVSRRAVLASTTNGTMNCMLQRTRAHHAPHLLERFPRVRRWSPWDTFVSLRNFWTEVNNVWWIGTNARKHSRSAIGRAREKYPLPYACLLKHVEAMFVEILMKFVHDEFVDRIFEMFSCRVR